MCGITAQVSIYPLGEADLSPAIEAAVGAFHRHAVDCDEWFSKNRFAYQSELDAVRRMLPSGALGASVPGRLSRLCADGHRHLLFR